MSRLKTDAIRNVNASVDGITLDTSGNVAIPNELQLADKIIHTGDTDTSIRFPSSNTITFDTGGSKRIELDSSGNLLINATTTFSGATKLQVRGASSTISDGGQIFDVATTAVATGGTRLAFGVNEDSYSWIRSYESAVGARDLVFAGAGELLRITSDGKVGIGLTTPQATLDVNNIDSSSAGNHGFQMGSYGIRTNDINSYNHWYIERNYGGWQATPQVVLKASGHTGFNISNPTKVIHGEDSSATETNVLALRNYKSGVNTKPTLVFEASTNAGQGAMSSIQGLAGTDAGGSNNSNESGMKFIVRHGGSGTEREAFSVKKDGNIYFPSGQGVSFAATSDAANNANVAELLDDYEEGRHIVSITGSSSNPTVNLTMANLWYVKVGSLVTLSGELRWTTSSHGSGALRISLPFAAKNLGTGHAFQGTAQTWNIDWKHDQSSTDYILSEVSGNTSYMFIRCAANDNLNENSLKLGSNVIGSANSGYGVELCVSLSYRAE